MSSKRKTAAEISGTKKKKTAPALSPSEAPTLWPNVQECKWKPRNNVIVSPEEYDAMFRIFSERDQLKDFQLYNFDAIPWQIHLMAWEPATGTRHVLLETVGFGNSMSHDTLCDFKRGAGNWLMVVTDPEREDFDPFLLMMTNTYRLLMEDWLETAPPPQNLFWHNNFAPADLQVLAKFLTAYNHKASDGDLLVCAPVLPENWEELKSRNSLCKELQAHISEEWIKTSMTAMEIAKELDQSLSQKRRGCKHSNAKIRVLRSLQDEVEKHMRRALEGKDLRRFMEGLLPDSYKDKPFHIGDFKSAAFISHMRGVRGEPLEDDLDFSG